MDHGRRLGNAGTLYVALGRGEARWSLSVLKKLLLGELPHHGAAPRSQVRSPTRPYMPSWAGPSPAAWLGVPRCPLCHPALSQLPAALLTPRLLAARPALHTARASLLQADNSCDRRTAFLQVSKLTGLYFCSCKKCSAFNNNDRAALVCLPEPPQCSRPSSKPRSQLLHSRAQGREAEARSVARQQLPVHRPPLLQLWAASKPRDVSFLPDS